MKKKLPIGSTARKHLSRKQHTTFLAKPNFRVLRDLRRRRRHRKRPIYFSNVPRAALRAVTSSRTEMLAKSRIPEKIIALNKELKKKVKLTIAQKRALDASPVHYAPVIPFKASPRTIRLAVPRQNVLEENYEKAPFISPKQMKKMDFEYKKYSPYYKKKPIFFHRRSHKGFGEIFMYKLVPKKSIRRLKNKKQVEKYKSWLKIIATPKKIHKPAPLPKRKKRPLATFQARLDEISTPKQVYKKPLSMDVIFKVKRAALTYKASPRVKELSVPRRQVIDEGPVLTASGVNPAALTAFASPRIKAISAPVERKQKLESEFREDAFTVSPNALKAKCSKRLTELSRPVER